MGDADRSQAVHASTLRWVSADGCPRRALFSAFVGEERTEALDFGSRMHAVIEDYLRDGTPIDGGTPWGKVALNGASHLRALRELSPEVELPFEVTNEGVRFRGTVDAYVPSDRRVIDHKSSSSIDKYGHTPETLARDDQAILYAFAFEADTFSHWYYQKRSKKFRVVDCKPAPIETIMPRASALWACLRARVNPNDVPANERACSKYGRPCPYLAHCNVRRTIAPKELDMPKTLDEMIAAATKAIEKETADVADEAATPVAASKPAPAPPSAPPPAPSAKEIPDTMPPPAEDEKEERKAIQAEGCPRTLYEGCFPVGRSDVKDAWSIIREAMRRVELGKDAVHYKAVDFGKGPGYFVDALREILADVDGEVVIWSRDSTSLDALPAFVEWADVHIRATR